MSEKTKDEIISEVYNAPDGFGGVEKTYKGVQVLDRLRKRKSGITYKDVKEWLFKNVEQTAKVKGYNTYINNAPLEEFQIDHFTFGKRDPENEGLAIVDTFSKRAEVFPGHINGTTTLQNLMKAIKAMGKPKMIYADNSTSYNLVKEYCEDNNIKFVITTGHAMVAERFIRTFKQMLWKRIKADKTGKTNWKDIYEQVRLVYNNTVHTATGMTPMEATKPANTLQVKVNLEMQRHSTRSYPEIKVGDKVKLHFKKPLQAKKEELTNWSKETYTVTSISESFNQKYYHLAGFNRPVLRHDMLKVPN